MSQSGDNFAPTTNGMTAPLELAFWIDTPLLQREAAFLRHLITGLITEGHRITYIAAQGVDLSILPTLGSPVLNYRWYPWERLGILKRVRLASVLDELKAQPPDVLVVWGSTAAGLEAGLVEMVGATTGLPTVVWCWDNSELFTPLMNQACVRQVIVSSQPMRERVPGDYRCPVTLIHPGVYTQETMACYDVEAQLPCLVSLDPLADLPAYEAVLRACKKLADGEGGGEGGRGMEFLMFAYDRVKAEHPIWRLAEKLGLLDRISFVPFQQEAEPLLLHGDLFLHVLPSNRVNFATLDAMAHGLAVVTGVNHGADYLLDGQTCRLVKNPSAEGWYEALAELINDRAKGALLARQGQAYVREHHQMTRTLLQFTSVCHQAAGTPIRMVGA